MQRSRKTQKQTPKETPKKVGGRFPLLQMVLVAPLLGAVAHRAYTEVRRYMRRLKDLEEELERLRSTGTANSHVRRPSQPYLPIFSRL